MDLIEILQPPEDTVIYLIDSLRPLEVRNVYNGVQIKIIVLQNELGTEQKNVPEFEDIFDEEDEGKEEDSGNEDEDGNDDGDISDEEEAAARRGAKSKRKRYDPEYLEKRHKKREWEEKR